MKKHLRATIYYNVDRAHPDIKYIKNPDDVQTFTDLYTFDTRFTGDIELSEMKAYCKNDLKLVAGGGYNADHIHNVRFEFMEA